MNTKYLHAMSVHCEGCYHCNSDCQMNTKNLHVCEFQIKLIPYTLFKVKETSEAQGGQGATRMLQFVQLCKSRLVYPSLRRVCVCVCVRV